MRRNPVAVSSIDRTAIDRTAIAVATFKLYVDDTWATLVTTEVGGIRSFQLDYGPGLDPAYNPQGRKKPDTSGWCRSRLPGTVNIVLDQDGAANIENGHFENGDLRFIRFEASVGSGNNLRACASTTASATSRRQTSSPPKRNSTRSI